MTTPNPSIMSSLPSAKEADCEEKRGPARSRPPAVWSATQATTNTDYKEVMASYYVEHDFLVNDSRPNKAEREKSATIFVNPGTTPNTVVKAALEWMERNWDDRGPFTITWHTGGALVPKTLLDFKESYTDFRTAAEVFLLPGKVDSEVESVVGTIPVQFLKNHLQKYFSHVILSLHRLDLETGSAYFNYDIETDFQEECAKLPARQKFLFVDPTKFTFSGTRGYSVSDLLRTGEIVTIYTVEPRDDEDIKDKAILNAFESLANSVLTQDERVDQESGTSRAVKTLRLCMVSLDGQQAINRIHKGQLRIRDSVA